ncbi:hypothetical protein [Rhizomicrobium electricum]|uniref:Uncharacterized protein n=1 Tax=Rhizomicrobium electricum TaxID=480070 RepID=A0ABN1EQV6_9PROT|nr:hypothetical protein [Rhizomicrobium electricum]NIJ48937.1 hypothetical protein [Rhizomicrobium electricum]
MKKLFIGMVAFGALAASADAALVCATAPELKVLQSTALQQQLMVAALTCHMRDDYNRFVAAYRDGLMQSDAALKAFFATRPRGEDYNAYKTRVANTASLRSVHDPRFCDSARKVFDMALGRRLERRGLAPEPPQLVESGYEGCRAVDNDKLIEAQARPSAKVALAPKPRPRPSVPVRLAAVQSVRLFASAPVLSAKPAMRVEVLQPRPHVAIAVPKPAPVAPRPVQVAAAAPKTAVAAKPVMAERMMASKPDDARPLPRIASALPPPRSQAASPRVSAVAPPDRARWRGDGSDLPTLDEDPSLFDNSETATTDPPPREAYPVRQAWHRPANADPDDPYADNPIPSAYRPGAEWVGDSGPAWRSPPAWRERTDRPPPRRAYWVLGPGGHWMLVVPRARRW